MEHIAFDTWLERNPDIAKTFQDCPKCKGTGNVKCSVCERRGVKDMRICKLCYGNEVLACTDCAGEREDARQVFLKEVNADKAFLAKTIKAGL